MKPFLHFLYLSCFLVFATNCGKKSNDTTADQSKAIITEAVTKARTACNSASPAQSMQWLIDIVTKAEEDKQIKKYMGNYMGKISLTSYHNQPVFHIRMAMGSGGIHAYIYDCEGATVFISANDVAAFEQQAQRGISIYSNIP